MELPSADIRRRLRRRLLFWFRRSQRDLPWRADRDWYRIWVSEIMLQQTQVATVIPYFERFLIAFPTVLDLAKAAEQEVLRLWEGLGYYRRARNLHHAARLIVKHYQGRFPTDPEAAGALPGIGRYMVGAILSQAFDRRLPILETNSQRLLCRLLGVRSDPGQAETRKWLWEAAEQLLPVRHVGEFNQALMELGAIVCTPRMPRCSECPLAGLCRARELGLEAQIPPAQRAPKTVFVKETAIVLRRGTRILFVQRPGYGRWAGMWEFPHGQRKMGESDQQAAVRLLAELTGIDGIPGQQIRIVRHSVTHHRITMTCLEARYRRGRFHSTFYQSGLWLTLEELSEYPVSSPHRSVVAELLHSKPGTPRKGGRHKSTKPVEA